MNVIIKISKDEEYLYVGHDSSKVSSLNKGDIIYCKNNNKHIIKHKYLNVNTNTITISVF